MDALLQREISRATTQNMHLSDAVASYAVNAVLGSAQDEIREAQASLQMAHLVTTTQLSCQLVWCHCGTFTNKIILIPAHCLLPQSQPQFLPYSPDWAWTLFDPR